MYLWYNGECYIDFYGLDPLTIMKISLQLEQEGYKVSNNYPVKEVNFNELVDIATRQTYSLGYYKDNVRRESNFLGAFAIGLDIDNSDPENQMSLAEAQDIFGQYKHIIMTSRSHQKSTKNGRDIPKVDRFRVILFLSREINDPGVYRNTWHSLRKKYPAIDRACADPCRVWYASPGLVSQRAVGDLVEPVETAPAPERPATPLPHLFIDPTTKGQLAKSTRDFLERGAPEGEWNNTLYKAARDFNQQNYTKEEAIHLLTKATQNYYGYLDKSDLRTIDQAYSRPAKHAPRVNPNEALREFLSRSTCIIDIEDANNTFYIDLNNGDRQEIDNRIVARILGKEGMEEISKNRTLYCSMEYLPNIPEIIIRDSDGIVNKFNTYKPPFWFKKYFLDIEGPKKGVIPSVTKKFFEHLTGGHKESEEYIYDWLSTALNGRNYTILAAIGDQGIGKGVLGDMMQQIFGLSNFTKTRDSVFKKHFNAQIDNKQLVYVDEIALETKESNDRLKDVVNDWVEVEAKGKDAKLIENQASFYISSNHIDALKLDPDDRRISAVQLTDTRLLDVMTTSEIAKLLSRETIQDFAWYLRNRTPVNDMMKPFRSEIFQELVDGSLPNWAYWFLYTYVPQHKGKELSIKEFQNVLKDEFPMIRPPGRGKLIKLSKTIKGLFQVKEKKEGEQRELYLEIE